MQEYHKIQTLFKRDMDGSITGKKGKMLEGQWTTPELEYLADNEWEYTEKVDGTNIRIGFGPFASIDPVAWVGELTSSVYVDFAGRTDNAVIPKPLMEYLTKTFTHERFLDAGLNGITLYGEGYGPKIQGGGKYRDDTSFVLFDVLIGDFWLSRDNVNDIASKLGIDSVPVIGRGTLYDAINIVKGVRLERYHKDAHNEGFGPGESVREIPTGPLNSQWGDFEAEGIVARPVVDLFNRKGERIICKIKAVDFR